MTALLVGTFFIGLGLARVTSRVHDYVADAGKLTVVEGDYFGTGNFHLGRSAILLWRTIGT